MKLNNRVALVTGAGGPMGRAISVRLAEEGAKLLINDISNRRLQETEENLTQLGYECLAVRGSVLEREETKEIVEKGVQQFGTIDILINVVGGIRSQVLSESILDITEERWRDTMDLNLIGTLNCIQLVAPIMKSHGYGRIVNISTIDFSGKAGHGDYAAAKAGIASLTKTAAMELGPDVTVNCIAPGLIRTSALDRLNNDRQKEYFNQTILKRFGEPRDVANAVFFFSSDESSYITGEILAVSGGVWPHL